MISDIPEKPIRGITNSRGFLWVITSSKVYRYNNGFAEEFRYNTPTGEVSFADIASYDYFNWVVGSKKEGVKLSPLLLKTDWRWPNWLEVPLEGVTTGELIKIMPDGFNTCWLILNEGGYSEDKHGILIRFVDGKTKVFSRFGVVTTALSNTWKKNTFYAVSKNPNNGYRIYITADAGASWATEVLPEDFIRGRKIIRARAGAATGETLYIIVECEGAGPTAILKRSGAPGAGKYELAFLSYEGPYFKNVEEFALRFPQSDPYGISTDAIAVGPLTSVCFDEAAVKIEKLPYPMELKYLSPVEGINGFWALGFSYMAGAYGIFYHP